MIRKEHQIWAKHLNAGDRAIDATCGNGHDTFFLAGLGLSHLYAFDVQKKALDKTKERVGEHFKNISYHLGCHSTFAGVEESVELIVYNLGYLPGGDKSLTTKTETTLKSAIRGLEILSPQGLMSLTLYPGHPEGKREEGALLKWTSTLSPKKFQVSHQRWVNRSQAPSLLLIYKTQ